MTESSDWKNEYARLREYLEANPKIVLTKNEISIPRTLRDEFYNLFDDIRRAVVAKHLDILSVGVRTLSERHTRMEKEAAVLLGVEEISMPIDLRVFLRNPEEGLIRAIYNCLFAFIQGKIDEAEFERLAGESIEASVSDLFHLGYEHWVSLELIKLLEPEEAFLVGLDEEYKPCLLELETVSFGRQWHHPTMRIPEFVVRSRRFNSLVAVKMALETEIEEYVVTIKLPVRPRKRTGDTSFAMNSRVALLSFLKSEKEIPVFADIYDGTRTSPDLLVEFVNMDAPGGEEEVFERVRRHMEILKPKSGCTLIAPVEDFQIDSERIPENVRVVSLGFDAAKLETALDGLPA